MDVFEDGINNYRKIECMKVGYFSEIDSIFCNSNSSFRVLFLNIRSYNKNFDSFLLYLNSIKTKIDFIILGETWLWQEGIGVQLDGYSLFSTSRGASRNDGVIVYVSERVSASMREVELGGVYGLSLDFVHQSKQFNLLAVYRTHDTNLDNFTTALEHYYGDMIRHKSYVLIGDVNANLMITDNKTERYLDLLYELGFMCGINEPTRVSRDSRTCIDHIFVRHNNYGSIKTAIIETEITDHYSIYLEIGLTVNKKEFTDISSKTRIIIDKDNLKEMINECDWSNVLEKTNINDCTAAFMNTIFECVKSSEKIINHRPRIAPIKPWITSSMVRSIRKRDKLSKLLKKQPFNLDLKIYYRRYRNTLNMTLKNAKVDYYRNKINETKSNPKIFWQIINQLAGKQMKKDLFPLTQYIADKRMNTDADITKQVADEFNDFFSQVGYNLAKDIDNSEEPILNDADYSTAAEFAMHTITEAELLKYVNNIRGGSAPGYDNLSADFLKENITALKTPLLHIVNTSLTSGNFPEHFKVAKVIPLFKAQDVTSKNNFRPISLLSVFAKVLEKIVKDQLTKYLDINNILPDSQYGFRQSKNISDALFDLNRDLNNAISSNKRCMLVFLDLAKAFDTVDRKILLNKLKYLGIRNKAHEWFESYLSNRKQFVSINGTMSEQKQIDYGVIQGSTLGPLLFLLYINNFTRINIRAKMYLFADDTALFFEDSNWNQLIKKITEDLVIVKKWLDQNVLTLNISKTKFMPISLRYTGEIAYKIKVHTCGNTTNETCSCNSIDKVDSYKYLGVMFDSKLSWTNHVEYINKRLRKLIFAFKQLGEVLDEKSLRQAYFAYVQSIIEGGILAWGGAFRSNLQPLIITQKSIIKAALKKPRRYSTEELFREMKVFDIRQIYVRTLLIYIFKKSDIVFETNAHEHNTRNCLNVGIRMPRVYKTFSLTCSSVIAHYVFQNIPIELRQFYQYSLPSYKRKVKKWLMEIGRDNTEQLITSVYRV